MKTPYLIVCLLLCLQVFNLLGQQYEDYDPYRHIPDHTRLQISDVEIGAGIVLIGTGIAIPQLVEKTRGTEIPCYVFGTIFFIEGVTIRGSVKNKKAARWHAKAKRINRRKQK